MKELIRSNDPVRLSRVLGLLQAEGIAAFELDQHMSNLDGSIGVLPRRVMVADRDEFRARAILRDLELDD